MKSSNIEKRLEIMDMEIHSMLSEIKSKRRISFSGLSKKISSRARDHDTTELIRKMRDREY